MENKSFNVYFKSKLREKVVTPEFWLTHLISYAGILLLLNYIGAETSFLILYAVGYAVLTPLLGMLSLYRSYNKNVKA
ncbi:hypothetical protein [Bacillus massilinigeriensis]|uniref:hypothetical protein n=1 Tax=Bacillus mediterraneensis TaxID=1805474 RepID=UPI0008F8904D|nr:hypothetical protein [Bacillus mediterraneensis]